MQALFYGLSLYSYKSSLPISKDLEVSLRQPFSGLIYTSLPVCQEPYISLRPSLHGLLLYQVKDYQIDKEQNCTFAQTIFCCYITLSKPCTIFHRTFLLNTSAHTSSCNAASFNNAQNVIFGVGITYVTYSLLLQKVTTMNMEYVIDSGVLLFTLLQQQWQQLLVLHPQQAY